MYIVMERNTRGNLEIDEKILKKIIEYVVTNNVNTPVKVEARVNLHYDNILFILVKIYTDSIDKLSTSEKKLSSLIFESMDKTLSIRPKNVAFAYIKR